jgi:hypothetical protein
LECELPPGEWRVAFDHTGRLTTSPAVTGKYVVRFKSGVILYQ